MKILSFALLLAAIVAPNQLSAHDSLPFQSPWLISVHLAAHPPVPPLGWLERVNMAANPPQGISPNSDLSLDRAAY